MAVIAPWLQFNPLDVMNFAKLGGELGVQRSRIATEAQDAANRLALGYAQMAQEGAANAARVGASSASDAAANALHRDLGFAQISSDDKKTQALTDQSTAENALKSRELDIKGITHGQVSQGLASIFSTAGKSRDEINKVVSQFPEAASTLTGPQWEFLLGPKEQQPRKYSGPTMVDDFGKPAGNVNLTLNEWAQMGPGLPPQISTNQPVASFLKWGAGTNAPIIATAGDQAFVSESEARSSGHKAGDVIRIRGVGRVRLK